MIFIVVAGIVLAVSLMWILYGGVLLLWGTWDESRSLRKLQMDANETQKNQ